MVWLNDSLRVASKMGSRHRLYEDAGDGRQHSELVTHFASVCSDPGDVQSFRDDVLRPFLRVRVSDTDGSRHVRQHIKTQLMQLGWAVSEDTFNADTPLGRRRFVNVVAMFGDSGSDSRLTLACHYDSKRFDWMPFIGASDSAAACAIMIQLARCLNTSLQNALNDTTSNPRALQLIFFDGEEAFGEWSGDDSLYGSRHLAELMNSQLVPGSSSNKKTLLSAIDLMILLDLVGTRQTRFGNWFPQTAHLYSRMSLIESLLYTSGLLLLLEPSADHAQRQYTPYFYDAESVLTDGDPRLGIQDDHVPFMTRGVPVVHLISYPFPDVWHTQDDNETALDFTTISNIGAILRVFVADCLQLATA